jgi:hypothetical protein
MKFYAIAATLGLLTNVSAVNVSHVDTNVEFQTITVPEYNLTFERGTYEIIKLKHDESTILSDAEIIEILKLSGFSGDGLKMAWAIAVLESTLRPFAFNKASNCYGLFQINMSGAMGPDRREKYGLESSEDLFNPFKNATIAYQMSNKGRDWSAWTTKNEAKTLLKQFPG